MVDVGTDYKLSDRYLAGEGRVLLTGIQALARVPIEQLRLDHRRQRNTAAFLSGYPGSPLGGLDQEIARALALVPELPIVHQPAVNEELGATAVMGSQLAAGRPDARYDGVVGFWYGKAPGLDRAGDALRHGVFAGSSQHGGAVVMVGDDPACKSSTMPSSSDATLVDLHMPVLYPGTVAECLELGLHAVSLSRATGLWSAMKIVTPIADGSGTVDLPILDADPILPTVDVDGRPWQNRPSAQFLGQRMLAVEREFREVRLPLAHRYGTANNLNRVTADPADAWIGLVASGFTYYELLDALRRLGLDGDGALRDAGIRVLQLRMPVPFDADLVRHYARGLDEIVVVEEKNPTLEWLIKDALYGGPNQPRVVGKNHEDGRVLMQAWGRLDADAILPGLRERLAVRLADRLMPEPVAPHESNLIPLSVNRTPFFCSGCPHNWGTKVPDDALVGAGTGCHGMSLLMDADRVGEGIGVTAMGNEGAQWVGMEPFVETDHLFQNYGDGTYFHSAQLALQFCIGAGKHMTFKILYNSTVAMTGGQDSPYQITVPKLAEILLAQGVTAVAITTDDPSGYASADLPSGVQVHDRTDILAVQAWLRERPGVTVLIHDQACAAELRRDRKRGRAATPTRRVAINHRICEGCGDCGDVSNCLSVQPVETPLGRKTTIDQASCNYDESCLNGDCPAFMTVEVDSGGSVAHRPEPLDEPLPEPTVESDAESHADHKLGHVRVRMAGIGGTGVVTVAQVLATAAMLDGWEVRGLDQTGLSQKAGPVISDVVLSRPGTTASNLIGRGQADVVLGFDGLVAASDGSIAAADPAATAVVASTRRTPTGRMITQPEIPYPDDEIRSRLDAADGAGGARRLDAVAMTEALVGSPAPANVFLLGVSVQDATIPVSPEAVEEAIGLNGVAVEANLAAFRWGRRWAVDPARVEAVADSSPVSSVASTGEATSIVTTPPLPAHLRGMVSAMSLPGGLTELVELLAADLVGYQDGHYAERFLDEVDAAWSVEQQAAPGSTALTETVARSLHKLMAYKDEYEVARLLLLPEAAATVDEIGGRRRNVTWHLHPPMLKAFGFDKKVEVGSWATPAFRALAAGKRLRGTRVDPFGRTTMRRTERALVTEFTDAMASVYQHLQTEDLSSEAFDRAVVVAGLADEIRGYEELKLRRVEAFRLRLGQELAHFA